MVIINLYDSFDNFHGEKAYRPIVGEKADSAMVHMLSVVGYDDRDRTWILRNSYGSGWGNHGLVKVSMDDRRVIDQGKIFYPRM